jgi:hypothetical protein
MIIVPSSNYTGTGDLPHSCAMAIRKVFSEIKPPEREADSSSPSANV